MPGAATAHDPAVLRQSQSRDGHHTSVMRLVCHWQSILPAGNCSTAHLSQYRLNITQRLLPCPSTGPQLLLHHFNACRTLRFAASSKSAAAASVSLTQHSCSITAGLKVNVLQPCMQEGNQHTCVIESPSCFTHPTSQACLLQADHKHILQLLPENLAAEAAKH